MAYSRPATDRVVVIRYSITAMTRQQEHPGTGRKLTIPRRTQAHSHGEIQGGGIENVVIEPMAIRKDEDRGEEALEPDEPLIAEEPPARAQEHSCWESGE